ncbi:MAG: L-serine ammonia-lyase, iron-sulfur-dependent subunit beta [Oscillospiraceae bacterium]|nr:L-serine ammonia-lyase, iron-sulfur-dependent subunit beta [Oscillospiraceae bacterium]
MDVSLFDVIGPIMIGPSSSHTAGAARLGRVARTIIDAPFNHVSFGLHGSFGQTYQGHGTDRALLAGVLGLAEDDERLADAFSLAKKANLTYSFEEIELDGVHENSVKMVFTLTDGSTRCIVGSSLGGGRILITSIDGFPTEFTAQSSTLVIRQPDVPGIISDITAILALNSINIAVMKVSRNAKGGEACCIIETDSPLTANLVAQLKALPKLLQVQAINL